MTELVHLEAYIRDKMEKYLLISSHPSLYWVQSACSRQYCEPIIVLFNALKIVTHP